MVTRGAWPSNTVELHYPRHSKGSKKRPFLAALKEANALSPPPAGRGAFSAGDRIEGNYSSGVWCGPFFTFGYTYGPHSAAFSALRTDVPRVCCVCVHWCALRGCVCTVSMLMDALCSDPNKNASPDSSRYPATITAVHLDGYTVDWDDGDGSKRRYVKFRQCFLYFGYFELGVRGHT